MSFTEFQIESLVTATELPDRLAAALDAEARGAPSRRRMSPELSYGRHFGPAPHTTRQAAVMLLLFRRHDPEHGGVRWHLPLTERPATLAHHGGQISLPGGAIEPGESSHVAALRELHEELGVANRVRLVGQLAACYVYASDFLITPWLAAVDFAPQWEPHVCEVQSVVEMPLDVLLDARAIGSLSIERGPLEFHAPCYRVGDARVWGATCIILSELADMLRGLLKDG